MRIADKMQFDQVKRNIGKNRSEMSELQNQAATQKRVNKPSDDPLAASRVLGNRIDLQGNKQFTKSLSYAKSFLEFTDQSLGELTEIITRAKELSVGQANDGTGNAESRRAVATEIEQLQGQMVAIGNRKMGDRFIFGGFNTQQTPFDENGHYAGDAGEMMVHVDKDTFIAMNVPGGRVFLGQGVTKDGMVKGGKPQAKSIEEFDKQRMDEEEKPQPVTNRAPASFAEPRHELEAPGGVNLFHVMKGLQIALSSDDKEGVQDSLDVLDDALNQVVLARSQAGSRSTVIDNFTQTMEKQKIDNKAAISSLEDADVYSTVSDISKTESTLQATLETSGKLIQPSLLSFLR